MKFARIAGVLLATAFLASLPAGCGEKTPPAGTAAHAGEDPHDHPHGPHGGILIAVDDKGTQLEALLHAAEGEVVLHFLAADGKTPVAFPGPVHLNVQTPAGPARAEAAPLAASLGSFSCRHEGLRLAHPIAQISFTLDGKSYFLPLPEELGGHGSTSGAEHDHQHGHEPDHGHDPGGDHHSITRWTECLEWYIEASCTEPGKVVAFAVHLTRIADFRPAVSGILAVEATKGGRKISGPSVGLTRPGIFSPSLVFPESGEWTVHFRFSDQAMTDQLEWKLQLTAAGLSIPSEPSGRGGIRFPKESQWTIAFATIRPAASKTAGGPGGFLVPTAAVLRSAGKSSVLIQEEGELFRVQEVTASPVDETTMRVSQGLDGDERIVLKGQDSILGR